MNKIQVPESTMTIPARYFYNIEAMQNMAVDFWYESGETNKGDAENTGITTLEVEAVKGKPCVHKKDEVREIIDWDLCTLIEYVNETHHQFTRKNAVVIYDLAQKVAYRHSHAHPELNEIVTVLFFFLHDLLNHMMREEQILFPNIKQLLKDNSRSENGRYSTFGLLKEWVQHMQKEHQSSCEHLAHLHELTNNYSVPPDASDSHKSLFRLMEEFEAGLLLLMDIENNILFPKALVEDGEPGGRF
jgi:regulator of cell morphogenesis and NO signaling